ncbi:efflux RND transporter periplasmic adaptor subunit [Variovorax sp. J22G21]|uniref:efflux RND transporter periplasmic adaptor subunit n=1 Tax=Variovorax fucosicus TaxID=3053517 RepID=UPI0025770175|nr:MULTISPECIES: efflux RND transporter periplasmic adaptor subunit [unclassified Variovorax]MDM0042589.1 efflux RND transporter periplasmic adaptor subunit [Variovorax sp. J22R193]MDM0061194.1 efflux RND transporter periplasmic adaptor subunit [Variovorax sp. J22G21]
MHPRRFVTSALFCALPFALVACDDKAPPDPRTQVPLVRVATVQAAASASRSFTGTVAARVQSDLGFRVSGKVLERLVDAGQTVKRGQLLMRIDPVDLKLAARAQSEAVAAARARAKQASDEELRYRDLRGTGAISASAYDQVKAAADAAQAQLSAAEAQSDVARNANRYSELIADSDGTVVETLAEPGQVVNAGQPVVRVAQSGRREAVVQLPETMRPAVGSGGQATLFGKEGVAVAVKLRQLADAADKLTRTFEARYVLEGELVNAPLGATVTVRISDGKPAQAGGVQVPIGALFDTGKATGVWVIGGDPSTVRWQPVVVQLLDFDRAQVAGQLKQGDQVVALGAHLLREGEQVRVATSAAKQVVGGAHP